MEIELVVFCLHVGYVSSFLVQNHPNKTYYNMIK